jgi:hypothetical protein
VWAYASLGYDVPALTAAVVSWVGVEPDAQTPRVLANLAWSIAQMGLQHDDFFEVSFLDHCGITIYYQTCNTTACSR